MPVGTQGTVKGHMPRDVGETGAQILLNNTFHLMLRPGDELTILAYGPEESVYFERNGLVYSGFVPGSYGGDLAEVVRQPGTELWVRLIRYSDDRPASWVNTAQAGMAPRQPFCL